MKIYSGPLSMFGAKVEIAAAEKGIAYEREFVPFNLATLYEPKHPEVLRINPKAQVPVLVDEAVELFDSTQIFEYFEDLKPQPPLWPTKPTDRALARQLEMKSDEVFFPMVTTLMPRGRAEAGPEGVAAAQAAIGAYYDEMEALLTGREFLCGQLSYADIAFFMARYFALFLGAAWSEGHPNLDAWLERLKARPAFADAERERTEYLAANGLKVPTN